MIMLDIAGSGILLRSGYYTLMFLSHVSIFCVRRQLNAVGTSSRSLNGGVYRK